MAMDHRFHEAPRKVHLFHDQEGATYAHGTRQYVDTLCKGNWDRRSTVTTTVSSEVTCKMCLQRMMLPEHRRTPAREPVVKPFSVTEGDTITIVSRKPKWWQFRRMREWRAIQGTYRVVGYNSNTIILE
jgi:hypothetical protein